MTPESSTDDPELPDERPCRDPDCRGVAVRMDARNGTEFWECEECGTDDYRQSLS